MRISDWSSDVCSSDLRAACLDALAYPCLFLSKYLVEFCVLLLIGFQPFGLALLPLREVAWKAKELASVQLDDACRYRVKESAVVGNDDEAGGSGKKQVLKPRKA